MRQSATGWLDRGVKKTSVSLGIKSADIGCLNHSPVRVRRRSSY